MEAPDAAPRRGSGSGLSALSLPSDSAEVPRGRRSARRAAANAAAAAAAAVVPKTPVAVAPSAAKKRKATTPTGDSKSARRKVGGELRGSLRRGGKKASAAASGLASADTSGLSLLLDAVQEVSGVVGLGDIGGSAATPSSRRLTAPPMPAPVMAPPPPRASTATPPTGLPRGEEMRSAQLVAAEAAATERIAAAVQSGMSRVNLASGPGVAVDEGGLPMVQGVGADAAGGAANAPAAQKLLPVLRAESSRLAAAEAEGRLGPRLGQLWLRLARAAHGVGAMAEAQAALLRAWGVMRKCLRHGNGVSTTAPELMLNAGEHVATLLIEQATENPVSEVGDGSNCDGSFAGGGSSDDERDDAGDGRGGRRSGRGAPGGSAGPHGNAVGGVAGASGGAQATGSGSVPGATYSSSPLKASPMGITVA